LTQINCAVSGANHTQQQVKEYFIHQVHFPGSGKSAIHSNQRPLFINDGVIHIRSDRASRRQRCANLLIFGDQIDLCIAIMIWC